jgi:putative transposase
LGSGGQIKREIKTKIWTRRVQKCPKSKKEKMRKVEFANGEYYHIYNRGVEKRDIFVDDFDYLRFLQSMKEFNNISPIGSLYEKNFRDKKALKDTECPIGHSVSKALVEFIAHCLNPNHFHFIVKQIEDRGIEKFMHKLGMGYAKYFNHKNKRSGILFQGPFQSIHIDSNEYLLYLSAYVNKNHFIHNYNTEDWKYSSLPDYIGKRNDALCNKEVILGQFDNNPKQYEKYLNDNAEYFKEKKEMEKYILE